MTRRGEIAGLLGGGLQALRGVDSSMPGVMIAGVEACIWSGAQGQLNSSIVELLFGGTYCGSGSIGVPVDRKFINGAGLRVPEPLPCEPLFQ